jgi:hypothetical protein
MAEHDHPRRDPERDSGEPRRDEAARRVRGGEPPDEQGERIGRVATERQVVVVRELADRREGEDRNGSAEEERPQKNLRAPR